MGYYEKVFSKIDYRILIGITPLIGLLLLPFALNIPLGIDFTGGTELQLLTERDISAGQISSALSTCSPSSPIVVKTGELGGKTSIIVRTKDVMTKDCVHSAFSSLGFGADELEGVLPSLFKPELGRMLIERGSSIVLIAATLMVLVVFLVFRSPVPSIAVIQAAVFDILIAMGLLSLLGFELNLAGVAAFLMLIGYSVDTDIMLTSRILRQGSKSFAERANEAFTTGITMTGTTLAAMSSIFIVTSFIQMDTVAQIAAVILAGLTADIATTWFTNLAILKWHSSRSRKSHSRFRFSLFRQ